MRPAETRNTEEAVTPADLFVEPVLCDNNCGQPALLALHKVCGCVGFSCRPCRDLAVKVLKHTRLGCAHCGVWYRGHSWWRIVKREVPL